MLSVLPAYFMSCIKHPQCVIDEIEMLSRSFFWEGKSYSNGSDCLVAGEFVCRSVEEGGLGIKNMQIQSTCLLTKFVQRILMEPSSPWARWVLNLHMQGKDFDDQTLSQTRACGRK